ncbi:DUF4290 domain-containing protein [Compostibacter hankyongensis]
MEYNTSRNHLIMREYGRNIQKMVEYLLSLEDQEKRQKNTMALIELMGTLNPHLRNVEDFRHKLWDHLFLISDFSLEVDSPYPIPTRETLKAKPAPLPYPKKHPRFRHFGKNLEMVIDKALQESNEEKREGFTQTIGNYMKLAYANWHKESIHDDMIRSELSLITDNQLSYQTGYASSPQPFVQQDSYRPANKRKNYSFKSGKNGGNGKGNGNGNGYGHTHTYKKYNNKNRNK